MECPSDRGAGANHGPPKLSDIELSDAEKPSNAHNALTNIEENGKQLQILRDNMPFGRPGHGEFGTYFIGYCRTPRVTETMLQNMFVGRPPGNYDHILDFSRAVTGNLFFVPTASFLDRIDAPRPGADASDAPAAMPPPNLAQSGSLGIGSLKGEDDE